MQNVGVIQKTKSFRWRLFRGPITSADANLNFNGINSGGCWNKRKSLGAIKLDELFKEEGFVPNVITIAPVAGPNSGLNIRFFVGVYKGPGNNMDRICLVSAKTGGYSISAVAPRPEIPGSPVAIGIASARYCDQIAFADDYDNSIDRRDCTSGGGKGYIAFDLNGATDLMVRTHSTLTANKSVWFEAGGLY